MTGASSTLVSSRAGVIEVGGPVTEELRAGDPLQAGSPLRTPRAATVA